MEPSFNAAHNSDLT